MSAPRFHRSFEPPLVIPDLAQQRYANPDPDQERRFWIRLLDEEPARRSDNLRRYLRLIAGLDEYELGFLPTQQTLEWVREREAELQPYPTVGDNPRMLYRFLDGLERDVDTLDDMVLTGRTPIPGISVSDHFIQGSIDKLLGAHVAAMKWFPAFRATAAALIRWELWPAGERERRAWWPARRDRLLATLRATRKAVREALS